MIRSKKDIKKSLLKRAFQEARASDVILLIQWRQSYERHKAKSGLQEMERRFQMSQFNDNKDSRTLNAFNFIAHIEGRKDYLSDNSKKLLSNDIIVDLDLLKSNVDNKKHRTNTNTWSVDIREIEVQRQKSACFVNRTLH